MKGVYEVQQRCSSFRGPEFLIKLVIRVITCISMYNYVCIISWRNLHEYILQEIHASSNMEPMVLLFLAKRWI